jgi:hypothetical protein
VIPWFVAALACNSYELFRVQDARTVRPNAVDVLFVIDNSDSMAEESVALAENFGAFVTRLAAADLGPGGLGLPDAVDDYVAYSSDPAAYVDFQLAITTIDAQQTTGALVGDPAILRKGDPGLVTSFVRNLMCEATCFDERSAVESIPGFVCGGAWDGRVGQEFLDCLCGADAWLGHCSTSNEEGLEAVYGAMCRAVDAPPAACFEDTALGADARGSNAGLVRPGTTFVPVVVTDEGDASHRMQNVEAVPTRYTDLLVELGVPTAWAVIGPGLDENDELVCPGLATSWGTLRYEYLVRNTGGVKVDIHDAACAPGDFADALVRLGDLVGGGIRAYKLPREPVPASIVVEVGARTIDPARILGDDVFGEPVYSDGWTYDAETWTVLLHGEIVVGPEDEVRIWYRPAP